VRVGLVVPGFSADADDWCIPALRHLVAELARTEDVRVIALRYPYRPARYAVFGAEVTAISGGNRAGARTVGVWQRTWQAIAAEHRRRPFDVLHAFWANETGVLTAVAGRALRVPVVVSLAGGELAYLPEIGYGGLRAKTERIKVRLALRLASFVTAGSHSLLRQATHWIGSELSRRSEVLPLGVNRDLFSPEEAARTPEVPHLIQVASLSPVKDQQNLLQAAKRLVDQRCEFVVDLVGMGPLESGLRRLRDQLGLGDRVRFLGPVAHHHLAEVYRGATLYVQSSRHEAQGMAVLEAAACRVPTVGTSVGVVPELAPVAAISVPVGDPDRLAGALVMALADEQHRVAMGLAAQARVEADYDLTRNADRFRRLYARLPKQPPG
jgi:glycosyltransferase involved in cell wall biosynthesis